MAPGRAALMALVAAASGGLQLGAAEKISVANRANPIRRVVNMLQSMAKKVESEGEAEDKLYEKFFCYCKGGKGELEVAIADAETKIPQLESSIKETEGQLAQLGGGTEQAKKDRADAKAAVAEATALREKEAAAYATSSGDMKTNIAAMGKAITALEKGAGGSFLQTKAADLLRKVSINADISSNDRDMLSAFLSTDSQEGYAPQSGQITGILKQLKDTMEADLAETEAAEAESIKSFDSLMASKNKEIEALTQSIEDQITRNGEAGVALTNLKEDLDDTSKQLVEDKKFLGDLDKNCATKKKEQEERQAMRSEEIVAIQETIKILNDDDALELFKKTLPGSASLLQLKASSEDTKARAVAALKSNKKKDYRLDLISLALKGKKVSFDKVIGMVDEMVALLGKEQKDDDEKKEYCESEIDKTEDDLKMLKQKGADLAKAIEETKGAIATLGDEINSLVDGVAALDKEVKEATEQRKEANAEFKETTAANNAAVELLGMAKNRLNKFYNPKLYKEPALVQADPGPAPEVPTGEYKPAGEESNGIIAMIDMLIADVEKEVQTMAVEEKNAQEEYEEMMADSAEKRTMDLKTVEAKEAAKAEAEGYLQKSTEESKATMNDEMATAEILGSLHQECDWLLQNFEVRKSARAGEVEALKKAKAVLSGADYSLLQRTELHSVASLRGVRRA